MDAPEAFEDAAQLAVGDLDFFPLTCALGKKTKISWSALGLRTNATDVGGGGGRRTSMMSVMIPSSWMSKNRSTKSPSMNPVDGLLPDAALYDLQSACKTPPKPRMTLAMLRWRSKSVFDVSGPMRSARAAMRPEEVANMRFGETIGSSCWFGRREPEWKDKASAASASLRSGSRPRAFCSAPFRNLLTMSPRWKAPPSSSVDLSASLRVERLQST